MMLIIGLMTASTFRLPHENEVAEELSKHTTKQQSSSSMNTTRSSVDIQASGDVGDKGIKSNNVSLHQMGSQGKDESSALIENQQKNTTVCTKVLLGAFWSAACMLKFMAYSGPLLILVQF